MEPYILHFKEIDKTKLLEVGGKAVNLGELSKIDGIQVPDGFCVTTEAYKRSIENNTRLGELFKNLMELKLDDRDDRLEISKEIRLTIESIRMAENIESEIRKAITVFGEHQAYAIRSSATAEDLPYASFAGQQDTYLNIRGKDKIIQSIIKCWASIFTYRAIIYRIKNGFDHRKVLPSVVVQRMIMSEASGVMFTADPMTSDRKTISIEAGFGLGEALVSGLVNPDIYKVRDGKIVERSIGTQKLEIRPTEAGGIEEWEIQKHRQQKQVLTNTQILHLASMGKNIETHFKCPQDIEWCLINDEFYIVQSRPITTLFPIPESKDSKRPRVYMSIGHTQMMTDTIKPLGISFSK